MNPIEAFSSAWQKSFNYSGKATRPEYWWFVLINAIIYGVLFAVASAVAASTENPILMGLVSIYAIAQIFPSLAVSVRRLRDSGKEWVWLFINFVPCIGGFWFIYLMVQPSIGG